MKNAVIIMNLGTPVSPTKKAVRAFLREFLSDPRVVEVPRLLWWCILYGVILPFRTPKVTHAYQSIWGASESPLRQITLSQADKLQAALTEKFADNAPVVAYAMSYAGPGLESVVNQLESLEIDNILILPLYPQYSATTTGSIYDSVARLIRSRRNIPQLQVVKDYHRNPIYIQALAESVKKHWQNHGQCEVLLMSFHGIPQRNVDLGDPYYRQCKMTAELLAQELGLTTSQWSLSFQSRLGRAQWLMPYTSDSLQKLGQKGIRSVDVICPAFSADCLETLEEIAVENKEVFIGAGGSEYHLIPCLNDQTMHIEMMVDLVERYLPRLNA